MWSLGSNYVLCSHREPRKVLVYDYIFGIKYTHLMFHESLEFVGKDSSSIDIVRALIYVRLLE